LLAQTRVAGSAGQLSAERLTDCIEEAGDDPQGLPAALLALAGLPSGWRARLEILERVPSEVIWPRGTTDARCALVARKRLGRQPLARLTSDESLSEAARALCRVALGSEEPAEPTTETTLGSFGAEVTLARHSRDVREKARAFAARCGLPESLAQDVALAAFLHDAGKAERRFQAFLRGGDELDAIGRPPLAKSAWEPGVQLREARRRSRLPDGARHEAWSVRLAESLGALGSAHDPDLVLWLIGTHHGFGRPFFPPIVDGDAGGTIELDLEDGVRMRAPVDHGLVRLDAGWVERFERLRRRYGPWGLARLEAILRLADHRASEEEAAGGLPAASAEAHRHG